MDCKHTNILSLGRCGSYPVSSGIDAILKSEGVVIFAEDGTAQTFDGRNCRLGCTRRDYVNWTAKKFTSLQKLGQSNSHMQGIDVRHPKF